MPYLNVDEVALAAGPPNAAFTELPTLPEGIWEGGHLPGPADPPRQCRAQRGLPARRCARREWGSPDILVNFVQLLTDAYRDQTGIAQGRARVGAAEVRRIVEALDEWQAGDRRYVSETSIAALFATPTALPTRSEEVPPQPKPVNA